MRFKLSLVADNSTRRIYHRITGLGAPEAVEEIDGRMAWDGQDAWISCNFQTRCSLWTSWEEWVATKPTRSREEAPSEDSS